jgi:hypothetical protein
MKVAGAAAPRAHGKIACQMRLDACRKRRDFFTPDMDPLNLTLTPNGISVAVQAITDYTVDSLDAGEKRIDELICNGYGHDVWFLEKITGDKSLLPVITFGRVPEPGVERIARIERPVMIYEGGLRKV